MHAVQVWSGRRIAPAHEGPRNESNNQAHEPTSGRSTRYGSGHLIRVFRDIGHIFSSLYPSLAVLFLSRFASAQGFVALRQTFALTRQSHRWSGRICEAVSLSWGGLRQSVLAVLTGYSATTATTLAASVT